MSARSRNLHIAVETSWDHRETVGFFAAIHVDSTCQMKDSVLDGSTHEAHISTYKALAKQTSHDNYILEVRPAICTTEAAEQVLGLELLKLHNRRKA